MSQKNVKRPSRQKRSVQGTSAHRRKKKKQTLNWLPYVIPALGLIVIVLLIAVIVRAASARNTPSTQTFAQGQTLETQVTAAPSIEATIEPTATIEATLEPTPTLEPTATPAAEYDYNAFYNYLPVIHRGNTTENKIAITVDDCFQVNNLRTLIDLTAQQGGKLTIFPIGENLFKDGMKELIQHAVFDLGFEIENHTWSHARIFRLSEEEMAAEIYKQSAAVSNVLGVHYHQNFFRFMGGDGEEDQRSHNYLRQLGFKGIADWTISGSDASMESIKNALAPGTIYLFHTTDADTKKLQEFIPYAVSQGYELVTMNELFGLEPNAQTDISEVELVVPTPQDYDVVYTDQQQGDYSWSVLCIQEKLIQLGYLSDKADGVYGEGTAKAVAKYQSDNGLDVTGVADARTQVSLLGVPS